MDRQRAETYLRLLGEAELRRVMARSAGSAAGRWHARRLELAAQALSAVDAVDPRAAGQIRADIDRPGRAAAHPARDLAGPAGTAGPADAGPARRRGIVQPQRETPGVTAGTVAGGAGWSRGPG